MVFHFYVNKAKNKHMNQQQAMVRLIEVVKGKRHKNYDRTVALAALYRKLYTGDGLDELLERFVARESDAAFAQRKKLTVHVVPTTAKNIMDVFNKVPRSNYQRILKHETSEMVPPVWIVTLLPVVALVFVMPYARLLCPVVPG